MFFGQIKYSPGLEKDTVFGFFLPILIIDLESMLTKI